MISKEDKVKLFVNELNDIQDADIRAFAQKMIEEADDYFFIVPASSSGKYHPQFDLGDGGLVRHTRCVAYYAACMAESFNMSVRDKDLLIVCGLAHDIKKQGNGNGHHTVTEHPILAADYFVNLTAAMPNVFTAEEVSKMAQAIRSHMGKWGAKDGLPVPESEFDKCLQAADYIASRKDILEFNFRPTEEVKIETTKPNPGDFIIDFGKYKGQGLTVKQIHESEAADIRSGKSSKPSTYIEWIANASDFAMKDAQEAARKFLAEYKTTPPPAPAAQTPIVTVQPGPIDDLPF